MEHLCLIHQVPLNPTLLCGRVCHPFALIKSWLFSSPHFSCSISNRDCFFSLLHYLLGLNALYLLSRISLSGCKILPAFTLWQLLPFILPCFGSGGLSLYLDPVPPNRFIPQSALFFLLSPCFQWHFPPPYPSHHHWWPHPAPWRHYVNITGQWNIGFKHPPF